MASTFRPPLPIDSSEITPEALFWSRRKFIKLAGLVGISAALAACTRRQRFIDSGRGQSGYSNPSQNCHWSGSARRR